MTHKFFNHTMTLFLLILYPYIIWGQSERETRQPPQKIMDAVGVKPGMIIGEPGAGNGYFTFPLAERTGNTGKVYANEISQRFLDEIQSRAQREKINNIVTVLGDTEDPLFPQKNLDMIIMVLVLHHLEKPLEFMENLKKYMNADTQLVIIERNTQNDRAHYPAFMSKKQILNTMEKTNYELERTETFLSDDTIYIYKLKE